MIEKEIKNTAVMAAKEAGRILLKEYWDFDRAKTKLKAHNEIVTKADLMSEETIIGLINKKFPAHRVLSEERGISRLESDYLWIIDPLDGTTNFSIHNPLWAVSIGVAYKSELIAGVIYAPVIGELYTAVKGQGPELNGDGINVSTTDAGKMINTYCNSRETKYVRQAMKYHAKMKMKEKDCRQLGSAAIELAYVAAGRIESFATFGINLWDVAAGALLVREAGGRVTDFEGRGWTLDSIDMVASNGKVHKEILKVVK